MTITEICKATKGITNLSDFEVRGVTTDSRGDVAGKLFVPLIGESFDGHNYIKMALEKGALCALSEKEGDDSDKNSSIIKVDSTRQALIDLASYTRNNFNGPVVAITGSAGKTTTKDMIASVLSQKYNTLKTLGNFNNDIGLPLTLLSKEAKHEAMVLEMGMNHLGEIRVLSHIGKPNICLITNIGDAHIENLGSREGILKAKSEIFEGMQDGGTVILNGDDPLLVKLPKIAHAGKTIYCHLESAKNIVHKGLRGISCIIEGVQVDIPIPGKHNIMNALMSFAVGMELGLNPGQIAEGIKNFRPSGNRMAISEFNGITIINDTYNASPSSMKATLDMLKETEGRKVGILGDMFELGEYAEVMHKEVGQHAALNVDLLIAIGPLSKHMYDAFINNSGQNALYYKTKEDFISEWQSHLKPGDAVLVKASRGMALEAIVEKITNLEK